MPFLGTRGGGSVRGYGRYGAAIPAVSTINSVSVTSGTSVTIGYTLGSNNGAPISNITIVSSPSIALTYTNTDLDGSIVVTGTFSNAQAYTFTLTSTNAVGTSVASSASNSVTPLNTPVVTGGTLYSDATYYYRKFTGNGTLSVSALPLSVDTLVVAGGGPGFQCGGGGAGGLRGATSTLSPGSYSAVIGAAENDSSFNGITAARGGSGGYGGHAAFINGLTGGSGGGATRPGYNGAAGNTPSTTPITR